MQVGARIAVCGDLVYIDVERDGCSRDGLRLAPGFLSNLARRSVNYDATIDRLEVAARLQPPAEFAMVYHAGLLATRVSDDRAGSEMRFRFCARERVRQAFRVGAHACNITSLLVIGRLVLLQQYQQFG